MIDSCASEFSSYIPYFYSTYEDENESIVSKKEKIIVLGSGPVQLVKGLNLIIQQFMPFQQLKMQVMKQLLLIIIQKQCQLIIHVPINYILNHYVLKT